MSSLTTKKYSCRGMHGHKYLQDMFYLTYVLYSVFSLCKISLLGGTKLTKDR